MSTIETKDRETEKQEAIDKIRALEKEIFAQVPEYDKAYSVQMWMGWDVVGFKIKHEKMNWTDFVEVRISNKGEASFSHGSGGWNGGFTYEEVMDATIKCFEIAKSIMSKAEPISNLFKEVSRTQSSLDRIWEAEANEKRDSARETAMNELEGKYQKVEPEEIIEILKNQAHVDVITIGNYKRDEGTYETYVLNFANHGFEWNTRMNLYVSGIRFQDDGSRRELYRDHISKKDLENYTSLFLYKEDA